MQNYFMQSTNARFSTIRADFIHGQYQINQAFRLFSKEVLFLYIIAIKHKSIRSLVAKYCYTTHSKNV